jgi:hypothetical protein
MLLEVERDPMSMKARTILYLVTAAMVAAGTAVFSTQGWGGQFPYAWFTSFMTILGAVAGLSVTARWLEPGLQRETRFVRHLAYGGLACVGAALLDIGPYVTAFKGSRDAITTGHYLNGTTLSIAIVLFLVTWPKIIDPARRERIALGPALSAAFLGFLVNLYFDGSTPFVIGTLAGITLAVQACSAFDPLAIRRRKQSREVKVELDHGDKAPERQQRREQRAQVRQDRQEQRRQGRTERFNRLVTALDLHGQPRALPAPSRVALMIVSIALLGLGLAGVLAVITGSATRSERIPLVFFGATGMLVSFCLLGVACRGRMVNSWSTFIRPLLLMACIAGVLTASLALGGVGGQLHSDEVTAAIFFIIFPPILMLILGVLPRSLAPSTAGQGQQGRAPDWQTPPLPPQDGRNAPASTAPATFSDESNAGQPASSPAAPAPAPWPPDPWASQHLMRPNRTNPLLATLSALLMILSLVSGLIGTLSRPAMTVVAGFDKNPPAWFDTFMAGSWQGTLDSLQMALSVGFMFLAVLVLIVARRWAGGAHMFRAIVGAFGMLASLHLSRLGLNLDRIDWADKASLVQHGYYQDVLREVLDHAQAGAFVWAGLVMLASVLVLAWPPRRQEQVPVVGKGV